MNIELQKSKSKEKPHVGARHPRIQGRYVEFGVDIMSPQEPTPSEGSGGRSEGQAGFDKFQDATESPSTVCGHPCDCQEDDGGGKPGDEPREKLRVNTDRTETEDRESHHGEEQEGPGRGDESLPVNGRKAEAKREDEKNLDIDEHADAQSSIDGPSDSEGGVGDDGKWNAVCVACLRVYSRDPDLTITLVGPEDKQGASNLVRGQEPAGATM